MQAFGDQLSHQFVVFKVMVPC